MEDIGLGKGDRELYVVELEREIVWYEIERENSREEAIFVTMQVAEGIPRRLTSACYPFWSHIGLG